MKNGVDCRKPSTGPAQICILCVNSANMYPPRSPITSASARQLWVRWTSLSSYSSLTDPAPLRRMASASTALLLGLKDQD